jgi:predicted transcriptional regulator
METPSKKRKVEYSIPNTQNFKKYNDKINFEEMKKDIKDIKKKIDKLDKARTELKEKYDKLYQNQEEILELSRSIHILFQERELERELETDIKNMDLKSHCDYIS